MVEKITIAKAIGRKVTTDLSGSWLRLERYDPFEDAFFASGFSETHREPVDRFLTVKSLAEYGLQLEPSPEELEMIQRARLTKKVSILSAELTQVMTDWLNKPKAR